MSSNFPQLKKYQDWLKSEESDYTPWIKVHDLSSWGLSSIIRGFSTSRNHHFLSNLELATFLLLDWDSLIPIQRLEFLEVYFHILDNDIELAALQLSQLTSLERKFLNSSIEAIFHEIPIVNFELYYQPLLIKLKQQGFANWEVFGNTLNPLSFEDIYMNRMWLMMFAQGTKALQFKYIAERAEGLGSSIHGLLNCIEK